ncbi:MAG: peptidylprolyl isomerase [Candidatus Aenigmarchaeota archaeon]|nr:peptidylprolyl isomerase [Candidatus Aenigmarchaeota archaeon]
MENPVVEIKTNYGSVKVELFQNMTPKTVENFLRYVNDGYYDGLIFHRVINNFMIQGGGFEPGMKARAQKYTPIINEAKIGPSNIRGTTSMARTNDPDSATSEFFINTVDNEFLDPGGNDSYGYAVFGKVISGMDVVDKISKIKTKVVGFYENVPLETVLIQSIKVVSG